LPNGPIPKNARSGQFHAILSNSSKNLAVPENFFLFWARGAQRGRCGGNLREIEKDRRKRPIVGVYGILFLPRVRSWGTIVRIFFRKWGSLVAGLRTAGRPLLAMIGLRALETYSQHRNATRQTQAQGPICRVPD
jgi:hypothetical protein